MEKEKLKFKRKYDNLRNKIVYKSVTSSLLIPKRKILKIMRAVGMRPGNAAEKQEREYSHLISGDRPWKITNFSNMLL